MADDVTITIRLAQVSEFVRDNKRARDAVDDVGKAVDRADRKSRLASAIGGGFGLLGRTMAGIVRTTAAVTVGVGAAAVVIGKQAVTAASDLNETLSKTDQIFGSSSRQVKMWGLTTAASLGMSRNDALSAADNYGNLFLNLGATSREAAKMSKQLVVTASDLASFNNASPQEMLDAMSSALAGEFDPLQRYGFAINAAAVQHEALRMGLAKSKDAISSADTAQAAYSLILKQTGKAQGDFARTSGGLANQQRILGAQWEDLKGKAGKALLPAVLSVVMALNRQLLPTLSDLVDDKGPGLTRWITRFVRQDAVPFIKWLIDLGTTYGPRAFRWLSNVPAEIGEFRDWLRDIGERYGDDVLDFFRQFGASFSGSNGKNLAALGQSVRDVAASLGDLGSGVGKGASDTLTVAAVAMGWLADHTDLLAKSLPVLVALFVAYKAAQVASTAAEAVAVPLKLLEIATNLRLASSQRLLARSIESSSLVTKGSAAATGADTAAKNVGIVASVRQRAATVASTIATKAAAVATKIWTGGQWLLNAALTANPIGLVILAVVALIGIFILAYKRVGWFRAGVDTAMRGVLWAVKQPWKWIKGTWNGIGNLLSGPVASGAKKIKSIIGDIPGAFKNLVNAILGFWNGLDLSISVPGWIGKIPGVPDGIAGKSVDLVPDVPLLAKGGTAVAPGVAIVGEKGPEAIHMPVGASVVPLDPGARQMIRMGQDGRPIVVQLVVDRKVLAEQTVQGQNDLAARR